jgi:hypothetical protein
MISSKLKAYLGDAGLAYTGHPHLPAYTSQEMLHFEQSFLDGMQRLAA